MSAADRFTNLETAALAVGLACAATWLLYRAESWAIWTVHGIRRWSAARRRHPASCICAGCIHVGAEQAASMRKDPSAPGSNVRVLRGADLYMKANS